MKGHKHKIKSQNYEKKGLITEQKAIKMRKKYEIMRQRVGNIQS